MKLVQTAVQALLGDTEVQLRQNKDGGWFMTGGCLIPQVSGGEGMSAQEVEALLVWQRARREHWSVRQVYRAVCQCTRQDLKDMRQQLLPYIAEPIELRPGVASKRSAAQVNLCDLVRVQLEIAKAGGGCQFRSNPVWVILCADATPLWRSSATRCDVFVDVWGGVEYAGEFGRWATWWVLDGADDAPLLRKLQDVANLNGQVDDLQGDFTWGRDEHGDPRKFICFLTGDGKGMINQNEKVGTGGGVKACWDCNEGVDGLEECMCMCEARLGAFLPSVPPVRRVGDHVHGMCRASNAIINRLVQMCKILESNNDARAKGARVKLMQLMEKVRHEASGVPIAERVAPRPTKAGKFDLTSSRMFLESKALQADLIGIVRDHSNVEFGVPQGDGTTRSLQLWVVVTRIVQSLSTIHGLFRHKSVYSENQLTQLDGSMHILRSGWGALGWKSTPWVHWICAHSSFFARKYGSIYLFSSIPTERKNQPFKRDLKNCFKGWSLRRPMFTRNGLRHVVNMDALDQGIRLVRAKGEEGTEHLFRFTKRKRHKRKAG